MMLEGMWIWAGLGLVLLAVEMAIGTMDALWFGIAALCLAVIMWIFPNLSQPIQYVLFSALSLCSLAIWRVSYRKNDADSRLGQGQGEEIGRTGTVVEACGPNKNGKIQFTQGLMGAREWTAVASTTISKGAEAEVVAVEGNSLRIKAV